MRLYILLKSAILAFLAIIEAVVTWGKESEKSKNKVAEIAGNIIMIIIVATTIGFSLFHVYCAVFPDLQTKVFTLSDSSNRFLFEYNATFYDGEQDYIFFIPTSVVKDQLADEGLVDEEEYIITFENRSGVVSEIHHIIE